jgi:hypothetical protein
VRGIATYREVDYDDPSHRYFLGNITYRSATQIVDKFIPPFDAQLRARGMVEKYGQTVEYWLKEWKQVNATSLVRGDKIHSDKEELAHNRGFTHFRNKDFRVYNRALFEAHVPYIKLPDGCYPELKLWRHDYKIAGRSDKLIFDTIHGIRFAHIDDYKTNKKIEKESWQNIDGSYKMMLAPLGHLMDCNWVHYALQLSLYQFMLEYHGFSIGKRRIIHFPHPIEFLGTPAPVTYELPYLRKEVLAMLSHLTYTTWQN